MPETAATLPPTSPSRYVSLRDFAAQLGVHHDTARRWVHAGVVPAVRVGQAYKLRREDAERLIAEGVPLPSRQAGA